MRFCNRFLILVISLNIFSSTLFSQQITVAVVDFEGFGISQSESVAITNRLRNELFRLGVYKVVDRGLMEEILQEQDLQQSGCTSNDCLVEVGRLLGVNQMISGSIGKVGTLITVSARLVDVETGQILGVSDLDIFGGIEEVVTSGMKQVASNIAAYSVSTIAAEMAATEPEKATPSAENEPAITAVIQPPIEESGRVTAVTDEIDDLKSIDIDISDAAPLVEAINDQPVSPNTNVRRKYETSVFILSNEYVGIFGLPSLTYHFGNSSQGETKTIHPYLRMYGLFIIAGGLDWAPKSSTPFSFNFAINIWPIDLDIGSLGDNLWTNMGIGYDFKNAPFKIEVGRMGGMIFPDEGSFTYTRVGYYAPTFKKIAPRTLLAIGLSIGWLYLFY